MDKDGDQLYTSICSAATLQSNKQGFFQDYAANVIELAGPQWQAQFRQLTSDSDRLLKCYNDDQLYEAVHGVLQNVQPLFRSKSASVSQLRRLEGEKTASEGENEKALILLTQAVVRAPVTGNDNTVDKGFSLALALYSRAQTLWALSEYKLCLTDLKMCFQEKLPNQFRVEAYWLMSQCYLQLGEPTRARVGLQVTLKVLAPGETEWRSKINAQLAALTVQPTQTCKTEEKNKEVTLLDGQHSQLPGVSEALIVRSNPAAGRFVASRQPIATGDVLALETPHVACLIPDKFGSHCHHCFSRIRSAVACRQCAGLAFCSLECREDSQVYHQWECRYIDLMIGSGMSVLCHTALRTVTQQTYGYWQQVQAQQTMSPDYTRLATLVTHADRREPRDFISRTLMALFLLRILEHSKYIPPEDNVSDDLGGMRLFLATVLLHLLQCLQFNAHEIYETIYKSKMDFTHSKINYVAVGIYPSVALFNHDCYPVVARYFRGKELVLQAVRPLKPGEVVAENYGPVYTLRSLAERRRMLVSRYWFTCTCNACTQDWPRLADLDENIFNIRCKTNDCDGFVTISTECKKPKVKCPKCDSTLSVLETVILIKSYNADYTKGLALMGEGRLEEASQLLSSYSDAIHAVCRPPNKNLSLAHEALRSCWAYPFNKYLVHT